MKMKQIKKLAKRFLEKNDLIGDDENFLINDFVAFLERENKISKCGTTDGSPMMPEFPDLD